MIRPGVVGDRIDEKKVVAGRSGGRCRWKKPKERRRLGGGGRFERERKEITILGNLGIFLHNIQVGIYTSSLAN
jgi:hypothetical protein